MHIYSFKLFPYMNKKRTLMWASAIVATVVVAQVQRADFSSMQRVLLSGPEKEWAREAVLEMAADKPEVSVENSVAEDVTSPIAEVVEAISPSLVTADAEFDLTSVEMVSYEPSGFKESLFSATVADGTVAMAPMLADTRAGGKVVSGQLISTDLNYQNNTYHYRITLDADTTMKDDPKAYIMKGIYGTETAVKVSIDTAAGTVTIPYQKIATVNTDDIMIAPMYFTNGNITFDKSDIQGTINENGVITLPGWGLLITEGANAGRGYNFFTSSTWTPANVTVKAKNLMENGAEVTYGCLIEQTSDNSVTFIGLSGVTCETIVARINSKNQVVVPNSLVYTHQMYGDFYLYPCLDNGKANPGYNLVGKGNEGGTTVTFPMWTIASRSLPSMYVGYLYGDIELTCSKAINWPVTPDFKGEGKGTADSPYIIKTVNDYCTVAAAVSEGNDYQDTYFRLGADIDLTTVSESAYLQIGDLSTPFNGSFDGAGYTIKNLTVSSNSLTYFGLFGYIGSKGSVKNVKVDNVRISSNGSYAGVVAGWCEGTIDSVSVTGSVVIVNGDMCAGITGALKTGAVKNSSFQGALQGNGSVAGIVGQSHDGTITNCHVRANIIHRLYFSSTSHDAAGIVGAASKTVITGCSSTGAIQDVDGYAASGGLVGRLISESSLLQSFTTMSIQAVGNATIGSTVGTQILPYQGGLCGYAMETKEIRDCFSASHILQSTTNAAPYAGGLVGYMGVRYSYSSTGGSSMEGYPVFTNCYYAGQVNSALTLSHKSMYGSTFISTSWTGQQPYELTFVNSYYDNQIAMLSGDEWGRPTSFFTASLPTGFDASVWKSEAGHYPVLKASAGTEVSELASVALILADGQNVDKITKNFTISPATDVTWNIASGNNLVTSTDALAISGTTVSIKNNYDNALVVASSKDGWGMKYYRLSIVPKWFQGEGTEASPYKLSSASDFEKLNIAVSAYGQGHNDDYFEVTDDIDFSASSFEGIGTGAGYSFGGKIDGKNHSIKNLTVDVLKLINDSVANTSKLYAGLVGILGKTGEVKNINIDATSLFRGYGYLGSIAGYSMGRIENCHNYANVMASHAYVGGITGRSINTTDALGNPTNNAVVTNCYNAGNVSGGSTTVGGIVGQNYGLITYCQNDGTVAGTSLSADTKEFNNNTMGGIAGYHATYAGHGTALIDQCVNNGYIGANWGVGGIVGYISGASLTNSVNNALVISNTDDTRRGGIIGQYSSRETVENNYYDSSINVNGGSNNAGLGGITGLSSTEMTTGSGLKNLNAKVFNFTDKMYPVLATYKEEKATAALRSMVMYFPEGLTRSNVIKPVALSAGTTWKLANDKAFKITDGTLSVTMPEGNTIPTDTISGVNGAFTKLFSLSAIPSILKGEGSETSPFLIETPEDWNKLSDFMLETKYEYPGTYFRVEKDLDFKNDSIKLLAVNGVKFNGVFDGNGKTVSNFVYNNFNTSTSATTWKGPNFYRSANLGLFGTLGAEGTIKNLTSNGELHIYTQAGGIVGEVYGTVDNCHHKGTVSTIITTATGTAGGSNLVGGVAYKIFDGGQILNSSNSGTVISKSTYPAGIVCRMVDNTLVENCVNTGTVQATTTSASGIVYECGGTVRNSGNKGTIKVATGTAIGVCYSLLKAGKLEGCYNEADIDLGTTGGTVSGIVYNTTNWAATAGVEPAHTSWIKNCWNAGNLTGKATITGIAGNIKSGVLMENCWNSGNITAASTYGAYGITAAISGNGLKENQPLTEIYNCWNSGKITATTAATAAASGIAKTTSKGLIMDNCYNLGDVILLNRTTATGQICVVAGLVNQISGGIITNCWNAGNVKGMSPCNGGLAGYIAGTDCLELKNCFNLGDVEGSSQYNKSGVLADGNTNGTAGGLFGYVSTGNPKVINCYNAGTVKGNNRVGGIAGGMFYGTVVFENVYNSGKVICDNNWWSGTCYRGGDASTHPSYFENSKNLYYDCTVTPGEQYTNCPGSAKTTAELCALNMEGYVNGFGYPYLASFNSTALNDTILGVAGISTAVVLPAEGDTFESINKAVTLASTEAVKWTVESDGENGGSLEIEGSQARPSKKGAVKLIASSLDGKFVREFSMTVNTVVSGVDTVGEAKEVKSMLFVDMQGRIIPAPVAGQPYIVRITYTDGTSETRRMITHK